MGKYINQIVVNEKECDKHQDLILCEIIEEINQLKKDVAELKQSQGGN